MKKVTSKNILFISPVGEFYGGGERSGFEFCKFLRKNGHQVITAIPNSSKSYAKELEKHNMKYRLLECSDFECQVLEGNALTFSKVISQLMNIIQDDDISIVITNLYAQSGPIAAILAGVPNISMDRGQAYENSYFSDFMAKFSDAVIVNSTGLADVYKKNYQIITPVVYSYTATPRAGLDKNIIEQRIVCVSRISPEKNLLQVLKAAKILKQKNIFNGKILMIGPAPGEIEKKYQKELEQYAKDNNLLGNIKWLGDQKDPWSLVGENDIYLNTSDKESIGRSNIEAIKLGIPVVLADIPGHRDIFEKVGVMSYTRDDTNNLVEKIKFLLDNYSRAKEDAQEARIKAEKVISEDNCYKEVLPLIENMSSKTCIRSDSIFNYVLESVDVLRLKLTEQDLAHNREIYLKDTEIANYLGIKRSASLFLGNIKRRIRYGKHR